MLGLYDVVAHERTVTVMSVVFYQCRDAQSGREREQETRENKGGAPARISVDVCEEVGGPVSAAAARGEGFPEVLHIGNGSIRPLCGHIGVYHITCAGTTRVTRVGQEVQGKKVYIESHLELRYIQEGKVCMTLSQQV